MSQEEIKFENAVRTMLEIVGENPQREGLIKTPQRVFKAYKFLTSGYAQDPKVVLGDALFTSNNSEMVLMQNIEFYSLCEHHLLPIIGRAHVAYIPNGKVVGLSKIPRMVNIFARRLQIQEQLTEQIAGAIEDVIKPLGVGVVVCGDARGRKDQLSHDNISFAWKFYHQSRYEKRVFFAYKFTKRCKILA